MSTASDFTEGRIFPKLIKFMLPILGALVLQAMYGAVDILVVGQFGTSEGISAVSTGSNLVNMVTFTAAGFTMGVTILMGRYIGEKRQDSNTRMMIFDIPYIIEELSAGMTLKAGTVIATGTPSGVALGMPPEVQKYLESGDVVRCEIDGIGVLENTIA